MENLLKLTPLGVSPTDFIALLHGYDIRLINDFLPKYINKLKQKKVYDALELADIITVSNAVTASKKGSALYNKWRGKKIAILEDLIEESEVHKLTIFQRLNRKLTKRKRDTTVFDRLKGNK